MPNRIIKESTFTSDRIASLSDFEFRLWVGLITQADDAGRGDARPAIIKGRVFALRGRTTVTDIDKALHALAACGCVDLYHVDGKPYYEFPSWAKHQRVRDVKSKYPGKEESSDDDNSPQIAANCRKLPLESNPIQSESESNPNVVCTEQAPLAPVPPLPLNDGSEYSVTVDQLNEWRSLYPAVDVEQELRKMRGWLNANKTKRKTRKGIERFIANWLSGEQDKGHRAPAQKPEEKPAASYDINAAIEKSKTTVPILAKKERR